MSSVLKKADKLNLSLSPPFDTEKIATWVYILILYTAYQRVAYFRQLAHRLFWVMHLPSCTLQKTTDMQLKAKKNIQNMKYICNIIRTHFRYHLSAMLNPNYMTFLFSNDDLVDIKLIELKSSQFGAV